MKSFFQHINKTLLEKFPLVWNTRLVWILVITALVHLLFFTLGLNVFNNPEALHYGYADKIYIENGMLLFSIICSILTIVVWLIILFRNNSFKNYYPTSRRQLFISFFFYFIIFLLSTSFYVSYIFGYKMDITDRYPDSRVQSETRTVNLAGAFLSFSPGLYTIDQRRYPSPFDTLYCETKEDQVDFSKPYLQRFNDEYQFYTTFSKTVSSNDIKNYKKAYTNSIFRTTISDSLEKFVYRGQVVDVSAFANAEPSYFNYSHTFLDEFGTGDFTYTRYYQDDAYQSEGSPRAVAMNKEVYDFLKRNDAQEFKKLFTSFLDIVKELRVATNLTTDKWMQLVNRNTFTVEKFIENSRFEPDRKGEYPAEDMVEVTTTEVDNSDYEDTTRNTPENRSKQEQFYKDRQTNFYFDGESMKSVYQNIDSIKTDNHRSIFHLQLWLAFGLSLLLFIYRTTGLPALLFSLITTTVISILVSLVAMGLHLNDDLSIFYIIFGVSTCILLMPLLYLEKIKKPVQGIFVNITLAGFVPYLLLILGIIQEHQERYYQKLFGDDYYKLKPDFIFDIIGESLSYWLLAAGFIFVFAYTAIIKKWKALPEG